MVATLPVESKDEAFLYALYASTRQDELSAWGWDHGQQEAFLRFQFMAQQRSYEWQFPDADHRLVLSDGAPIGRILVARSRTAIRLVDISLMREARGQRVGTTLIRELQAESAATGLPLRLSVSTGNPSARRLYIRLGFTETGGSELYHTMEWWPPAGATLPNPHA